MNLKSILEGKDNLKEKLAEYQLKTGFLDEFAKKHGNRSSAQSIMLMQLTERIYSMSVDDLKSFFDSKELYCTIAPVFDNDKFIGFDGYIINSNNEEIASIEVVKTRKEAIDNIIEKCCDVFNCA